MTRVVIVGQAPSRTGDPKDPVVSPRLARLFGISLAEYRRIRRLNLLDEWPGKAGKGDAFPMPEARTAAERLHPALRGQTVLLMGKAVARAFGARQTYFQWQDVDGFRAAVFPHPSGVNRWWNDPRNRRRAKRFLRAIATKEAKGAETCRRQTPQTCAR